MKIFETSAKPGAKPEKIFNKFKKFWEKFDIVLRQFLTNYGVIS